MSSYQRTHLDICGMTSLETESLLSNRSALRLIPALYQICEIGSPPFVNAPARTFAPRRYQMVADGIDGSKGSSDSARTTWALCRMLGAS